MVAKRYEKGVSLVLLAFGLAALLGFAALAIDMGNAFNVQNELQKATTTAALAGASAFNPNINVSSSQNMTNINNAVNDTFNLSKSSEASLSAATIVGNIQVDPKSGAVRLQTRANAQTFFINIIGIKTLEVNARAAALNLPTSFIVMNDLFPLPQADQKKTIAFNESDDMSAPQINYYNPPPGGKVQIVCTLPLVNSPGPELTIVESGDLDGYRVFVASDPGGPWYNISSKGKSIESGPGPQPPDPSAPTAPPEQWRFFGSGAFDLDGTGIENARYVAVVDDAIEDGYLAANKAAYIASGAYAPVEDLTIGEKGIAMEVDGIIIHQHAMSITYEDLSKDENSDGIIDAHNKLIGDYDHPGLTLIEDTNSTTTTTP
ncbi:MAG: pilus assembly protein TadG-related protein [Cyanobacteriota bacterium]